MKSPPDVRRAPGKAPLKDLSSQPTEANLSTVGADINAEYRRLVKGTLASAKRIGELLNRVRDSLQHGQWLPWVEANCPFSERRAREFMQIADEWPRLEAALASKSADTADFPMSGALKLLARPKPINWEVRIGEAADVAPPLDPAGEFFTVTADDKLVRITHSKDAPGYYVIHRCGVVRDNDGDVVGVEEEEDVLRPLQGHAVGFWLEHLGCDRSDTWLRLPKGEEAAAS